MAVMMVILRVGDWAEMREYLLVDLMAVLLVEALVARKG